jgi:hypothetical protein
MSQLSDKLQQASQGGLNAIGFGVARRTKAAPLVLLARIRSPEAARSNDGVEAGADAIVLTLEDADAIASLSLEAGEAPWGTYLLNVSRKNAQILKEKGCDFVVFGAEGTEAMVLREVDLGKVLCVDMETPDSSAVALGSLSIDALWVSAEAISRPTVRKVIALRRLARLARKPLILDLPDNFSPEALEGLVGSGAVGVVVSWASEADSARLASLREAIDALPRPERAQRPSGALLPIPGARPTRE